MTTNLLDLTGKVALVTGGAAGIGRACTKALAGQGAKVMIADLNEEEAKKTAEELSKETGSEVKAVACNVLEDKDLVNAVDATVKELGGLNILVNNAGGGGGGKESPKEIEVDQFARVFKLNVFSAWRLAQLAAPHMDKAGYGSIINMTSVGSINSRSGMSAYASAKAAINHMGSNLAYDYGPNIRVNAVGPGATRTAALKSVLTPEIEQQMLKRTPLDRLGEPEDIGNAVLFFAAPISAWISGQTLFVNGGGEQTLE